MVSTRMSIVSRDWARRFRLFCARDLRRRRRRNGLCQVALLGTIGGLVTTLAAARLTLLLRGLQSGTLCAARSQLWWVGG